MVLTTGRRPIKTRPGRGGGYYGDAVRFPIGKLLRFAYTMAAFDPMNVATLFQAELKQRGYRYEIDAESGRHAVEVDGARLLVSLENLERDVAADGDVGRIPRFVDAIVASTHLFDSQASPDRLYWCLEPSDHIEKADFLIAVSDRVDRVLVHLSPDGSLVTWMTPSMLTALGLDEAKAGEIALANLGQALSEASLEYDEIDGVRLGFLTTGVPFKSSLLLAPNLREVAGPVLGWPLLAVAPDRNFLYLWAAREKEFIPRVGGVVVREYTQASYPVSTEVYEVTDAGIRAIGEFPKGS